MAHQPATPPTHLAELTTHINALLQTDRNLLAEQLVLEKQATIAEEPKPGEHTIPARTAHFMNGFNSVGLLGLNKGERLGVIQVDRQAIAKALSKLEEQRQRLLAVEAAEAAKAATPEWLALIRRTVLAAELLRSLEAEVAEKRRGKGGMPLPHVQHFGRPILATRWDSDPSGETRRALLAAGVITDRDLKEAAKCR